jgi:hypothetical protein
MATNGEGVNFTVKELLSMLEQSISNQIATVSNKLDAISARLEDKADRSRVHELDSRLAALELVALRQGGPVARMVETNDARLNALELRAAGAVALSSWQRWFFGVVVVGLIGALATIAWLATAH